MGGWKKEGGRGDPEKVTDENFGFFFLVLCVPDHTRSKDRERRFDVEAQLIL